MGIEFGCTQCGNLLRVEQEFAGRLAKCPACGQVQQAPAAAGDNPFASSGPSTPGVAFDNPFGSPASDAFVPSPAATAPTTGANQLDVGDLLQRSWEIFKSQMAICVLAMVVFYVAFTAVLGLVGLTGLAIGVGLANSGADDAVLTAIAILGIGLGVVVLLVFNSWLQAGMLRFFLKVSRDGEASLGDLFSGGPYTLPLLAMMLLLVLITTPALCLCVVPGVILMLMFSQAGFLIVDRGAGVIESLSWSHRLTNGKKTNLALVFLVVVGLHYAASLVPCGIGTIFVAPYISLLMSVTYLVLTDQRFPHEGRRTS